VTQLTAAIVGPGNIGTDLMAKLLRSPELELRYMVGVDPASDGLARARAAGLETSAGGVEWLVSRPELPDVVFEATSAAAHTRHTPLYAAHGIRADDLTPAALGPFVCPVVNLHDVRAEPNLNLITCGGQATVPIVHAVSRIAPVAYAEIVASIASRSAGPGTRANIDEFTETTALALQTVGGAAKGKAIIVLNPVDPPMVMRDTVFCSLPDGTDHEAVSASVRQMVEEVQQYVPGYQLRADPQFDVVATPDGPMERVTVLLEITGNGDYLPPWAGNLDIMTAAAARVGELLATRDHEVTT
jgi:acetaldehyde dehydrogenase